MQTKIFKRLGERIRKRIYIMRCQRALVIAYNSFMMSVREDNISYPYGLCYYVATALNRVFRDYSPGIDNLQYVQKHLPHYTYMNAALNACANGEPEGLWWRASDVKHRLQFLNWLMENMEE